MKNKDEVVYIGTVEFATGSSIKVCLDKKSADDAKKRAKAKNWVRRQFDDTLVRPRYSTLYFR